MRIQAPAAARNRDPILDVLRPELIGRPRVMELASGSGEHIVHFAAALPDHQFQPSDPDAVARGSIAAWIENAGLANVAPPIALDAAGEWPVATFDAVLCINMVHISPWAATLGLLRGAARALSPDGLLFLYGPYRRNGAHTAPSNAAFDADLQARNPQWGVRDLEAVVAEAALAGFAPPRIIAMPANNLALFFGRSGAGT